MANRPMPRRAIFGWVCESVKLIRALKAMTAIPCRMEQAGADIELVEVDTVRELYAAFW
jgi:hypothetical protein